MVWKQNFKVAITLDSKIVCMIVDVCGAFIHRDTEHHYRKATRVPVTVTVLVLL